MNCFVYYQLDVIGNVVDDDDGPLVIIELVYLVLHSHYTFSGEVSPLHCSKLLFYRFHINNFLSSW